MMKLSKTRRNPMTERTFTGKTGDVWTWEETPETIKALKQLHENVVSVNAGGGPAELKRPNKPS